MINILCYTDITYHGITGHGKQNKGIFVGIVPIFARIILTVKSFVDVILLNE